MEKRVPAVVWPPQLGDYARVRQTGTLAEVIEIVHQGDDAEYTVNLLAPDPDGISACDLDDLAPVWPTDWMQWTHRAS